MNHELKKIMYVEDEEDIRTLVEIALGEIGGFSVKTCGNSREALTILDAFKPDLVILDVMMPELDGPEILKLIRKNPKYNAISVIFMTARAQEEEIAEYRKKGAIDVIVKPFDPITLAEKIATIWKIHHE